FRLVSISAEETVFQDVNLGFRHKLALYRPAPGTAAPDSGRGGFPGGFQQPFNQNQVPQSIPGIPDTIPRYVPPNGNVQMPPQPQQRDSQKKDDVDDDDDN
ncbi:MAG TPA: hypothetical protein VK468_04615, partial [Pyrinomonadaceae bacterium]|nr:hypothetical protein [Pyrinomonadaceae bacterium]